VTTTAIAAVALRRRNTVRGEIVSVASYWRPWMRTDAVVRDGTGMLLLRFVGRASVPGLAVGRCVIAQGTPGPVRGEVVMVNPLYSFVSSE
jgi:hypothetical protein